MIQICNHNYLLADAEHRRQGFHPLLKGYGILVVDEAHKLWDAACQMYGEILSSQDFEELSNLLEKEKCSQVVYTLREKSAHFAAAFRQVETREQANLKRQRNAPGYRFTGASSSSVELANNPGLAIDYLIAPPRMAHYMEHSTRIYSVYLKHRVYRREVFKG